MGRWVRCRGGGVSARAKGSGGASSVRSEQLQCRSGTHTASKGRRSARATAIADASARSRLPSPLRTSTTNQLFRLARSRASTRTISPQPGDSSPPKASWPSKGGGIPAGRSDRSWGSTASCQLPSVSSAELADALTAPCLNALRRSEPGFLPTPTGRENLPSPGLAPPEPPSNSSESNGLGPASHRIRPESTEQWRTATITKSTTSAFSGLENLWRGVIVLPRVEGGLRTGRLPMDGEQPVTGVALAGASDRIGGALGASYLPARSHAFSAGRRGPKLARMCAPPCVSAALAWRVRSQGASQARGW